MSLSFITSDHSNNRHDDENAPSDLFLATRKRQLSVSNLKYYIIKVLRDRKKRNPSFHLPAALRVEMLGLVLLSHKLRPLL